MCPPPHVTVSFLSLLDQLPVCAHDSRVFARNKELYLDTYIMRDNETTDIIQRGRLPETARGKGLNLGN